MEKDPNTWNVDNVCDWLQTIGLANLQDIFKGKNLSFFKKKKHKRTQ